MSSTSSKNITCDHMRTFPYVLMMLVLMLPNADLLGRIASEHYCTWSEITCNEAGSVVSLDLDFNLRSDPYDIGNLDFSSFPNLERFISKGYLLEGRIPDQIGMLSNRAHLSLAGNFLKGTLPDSITSLTKLVELDLSGNNFESTIPSQIGNLKNLLHLDLSDNQFIGPIPSSFGSLFNLAYLDLWTNKLNGSIPQELSNLQNLKVLNLGENDLGGHITSSFGNLRALKFLNLGMNHISGPIPLNIINLEYLEHIDLSKNRMTGVVKMLRACTMLHFLDLSSNNFVGEAFSRRDLFYLEFLDQSENHLTIIVQNHPSNQKLVHHLVIIILPVIVGICFLLLGYVLCRRHKATKERIDLETIKHGDVCTILNYDGTIAYEDFISATEDFDLKYCIGTGGYGSVYEAKLPNGKIFALKKLHRFEAEQPPEFQK